MLGFVATDANIAPALLQPLVKEAADASFNRITIDGDTSTNDCFMGQRKALHLGRAQSGQEFLAERPPLCARSPANQLRQLLQPLLPGGPARQRRRAVQFVEGADDIGQHRLHQGAGLGRGAHKGQGHHAHGVHIAHGDAPRKRVAVVPVNDLFGQALHDSSIFAQHPAQ